MKISTLLIISSLIFGGLANSVFAATCEIKTTRTACPGKEAISFKKCKGKASCSKFKEADSADSCKAMAIKSCFNDRLTVTKSKVISALLDGVALKTDAGSDDFCSVYENAGAEFNHCDG